VARVFDNLQGWGQKQVGEVSSPLSHPPHTHELVLRADEARGRGLRLELLAPRALVIGSAALCGAVHDEVRGARRAARRVAQGRARGRRGRDHGAGEAQRARRSGGHGEEAPEAQEHVGGRAEATAGGAAEDPVGAVQARAGAARGAETCAFAATMAPLKHAVPGDTGLGAYTWPVDPGHSR